MPHFQRSDHPVSLDARVKLILTLVFILSLNLVPYNAWGIFFLFLVLALSVALYARLDIWFVLKRSLLAIPFVLAAFPLIFTGRPPMAALEILPGIHTTLSLEGTGRFAAITLRAWISIQAAILLTATTRFEELMVAFQQLKVPALFVSIVTLMWRYLSVIREEVIHMLRARSSRSAAAQAASQTGGTLLWRASVTGGMAGSLLIRSIDRSDRVYAAMLSRGYTGELPAGRTLPLPVRDRSLLLAGVAVLLLLTLLGFLIGG